MIKSLLPPILFQLLKKQKISRRYKSFDEALKHCQKDAYENADIIKVVVEKTKIYSQRLSDAKTIDLNALRTLIGIGFVIEGEELNVIDFGGGAGAHFFIAQSVFGQRIKLNWRVVETPEMVKVARELQNKHLKFFDSIEQVKNDLNQVDLVFTSGALHCCPDPLSYLNKLLEVRAKFFVVTRTALSTDMVQDFVLLQTSMLSDNGPGPMPKRLRSIDRAVRYPNVMVPKEKVCAMISDSYDIVLEINEDKNAYISEKSYAFDMYGFLCKQKC